MLVELSMVDQRHRAILEVESGAKVTDIALRYGVDRRTVQRWISRYASEGLGALANRTSKPHRCPHQMAKKVEDRIVELRKPQPRLGSAHHPQQTSKGTR